MLKQGYQFWTTTDPCTIEVHTTSIAGLVRYSHHATPAEIVTFYGDVLVPRFGYPPDVNDEQKTRDASPYVA